MSMRHTTTFPLHPLSATSDHTYHSASSDFEPSTPTTPDDDSSNDPFVYKADDGLLTHRERNPSETTIRKLTEVEVNGKLAGRLQPETVVEEETDDVTRLDAQQPSSIPLSGSNSAAASSSKLPPPTHPLRTPARTKRRSVSSTLSDSGSPTTEKLPSPLPPQSNEVNFSSLLNTPAPIIFSTPQERDLLNSLSTIGFDTAQIVHSVLSDACDSASAVWWTLKKKAERKSLDEETPSASDATFVALAKDDKHQPKKRASEHRKRRKVNMGVQTEDEVVRPKRSAPQLAFVPATPTVPRASTPPMPTTPTRSSMLSPSPSLTTGESSRSHPSTPASSLKDKESSKSRKARSGSVSIMQRATTALEAAGLVRKKSSEAVREDKEKHKEAEKRSGSGDEPRLSQSGSSKLTKSPPNRVVKDPNTNLSSPELHHPQPQMGSPWVFAEATSHKHSQYAPTPANSPGDVSPSGSGPQSGKGNSRHRASILNTFKLWFNEERKGKRKENSNNPPPAPSSIGRSSWKKSWGMEPPGWQTRTTHLPVEILSISPTPEGSGFRDVITGRQSINLGDESDWVDEDDEIPAFAGGLGQMSTSTTTSTSLFSPTIPEPMVTLSPAPKGHRSSAKRSHNARNAANLRPKGGHSPVERVSPIPMDNQLGRRQLPSGRSGPAFRSAAIQEEDEDEEE
ncbi:hypothetical protein ONZ45_g1416 [Pleurotus djamor]|nr:hypothetical protein ONZ45_g1416 [Pleurotus djamor]